MMRNPLTLGRRLLRFISPHDEAQRMNWRLAMDTSEAHTEDLLRTVVLDGDELRRKIAAHFAPADQEITLPPK